MTEEEGVWFVLDRIKSYSGMRCLPTHRNIVEEMGGYRGLEKVWKMTARGEEFLSGVVLYKKGVVVV